MIAEKFSGVSGSFALPDLSFCSTSKQLSLLILLATQRTIASYDLFYYDLRSEGNQLIEQLPMHFEMNYSESRVQRIDSRMKLVVNSRYYLLKYLADYGKDNRNFPNIIAAYRYIYEQILVAEDTFDVPRKMLDYIKFDVLNDVFYRKNRSAIDLIKAIYEGIEDVMNVNPQFKHQRAKSIFWLCGDSYDDVAESSKYIGLARHDTENILKRRHNEKLNISLEHIKYTQASIWGRICAIEKYSNDEHLITSLGFYVEALSSPENDAERQALLEKKSEKRIYEDLSNMMEYIKANKVSESEYVIKANTLANLLQLQ
jgi:hypothetical protein